MASNDIKSTYDANPTGCDDIEADYYIQVVKDDAGTKSDEGMSIPQLRAILQIDPGTATDIFQMSIPPNTLNAVVGTLNGDYTHWQIIESDTEPAYAAAGWNAWPMPTIFNVAADPDAPVASDWASKTWHLYTKDASIVHTILTEDGTSGITVTPFASTVAISDFTMTIGTPNTSEFSASWTDPNVVAGTHAIDQYDILDFNDTPVRSDVTSPVSFTGMAAGSTFTYKVVARYASGQSVESNVDSVSTFSTGLGTVSIEQPPSARDSVAGSGGWEIDEDAVGTLDVDIILDTAVGAGEPDVEVQYRFVDKTAAEGTDYNDDYAGTAGTAVFTDGGGTTYTVSLDPIDTTGTTNRCCQLELIDNAAKTDGLNIDTNRYDHGYGNAVLLYTNGSGGGTEGFVQDDSAGLGLFHIDLADETNSTDDPDPNNPGSELVNDTSIAGYVGEGFVTASRASNYKDLTTPVDPGTTPESVDYAPRRKFLCNFTKATANYTFHVRYRSTTGTNNDECSIDVDDGLESTLRAFEIFNPTTDDRSLHGWAFTHTDSWTASGQVGTSRTLSIDPGQHTISLNQYDTSIRADSLVIVASAVYDPATIGAAGLDPSRDDNYGPPLSTYGAGGGDAVDAETNPDFPSIPTDPAVSDIAPTSIFPIDGQTVDYQTSSLLALYSDASDIQGVDFRLYSWDGADTGTSVELSGTASVVGTSRNGIVFVPTNALQQSTHYYAEVVSGTAINSSGIRASIAFGGSVDWNFQTTSAVSTGLVAQVAFDNYTTNQLYTAAMAESDFLAMPSVSSLTTSVGGLNGAGAAYISDSPDGNPARGKVLEFFWEGTHPDGPELGNHLNLYKHFDSKHRNLSPQTGNIPGGISVNDYPMSNEACGTTSNPGVPPLTAAQSREAEHTAWVGGGGDKYRFDELHMAFDVYFPGDWQPLNFHKFPGMASGNALQASHGRYPAANREGYYGLTCAGYLAGYEFGPSSNYLSANPEPVLKTMAFGGYLYHTNGTQENVWCNSVDPTTNPTIASEHVYFPKGEWVSIEYRMALNSTDQDYTSIDYDPDWVGSENRWYWPTWAPQIDPSISTSVRRDGPTAATDLVDGVFEIWMKREGEATAKKILTRTRRFRLWEYLKITQGYPRFSNNPNTTTRISLPRVDQSYYVDNYRWKETPILPR